MAKKWDIAACGLSVNAFGKVTNGGNYTVLELVEKYVSLKTGVCHNTVAGYKAVINVLKMEAFGRRRIQGTFVRCKSVAH